MDIYGDAVDSSDWAHSTAQCQVPLPMTGGKGLDVTDPASQTTVLQEKELVLIREHASPIHACMELRSTLLRFRWDSGKSILFQGVNPAPDHKYECVSTANTDVQIVWDSVGYQIP